MVCVVVSRVVVVSGAMVCVVVSVVVVCGVVKAIIISKVMSAQSTPTSSGGSAHGAVPTVIEPVTNQS